MWLSCLPSSSSNVSIKRALCVFVYFIYLFMLFLSHESACLIVPSCISEFTFGITKLTVGNCVKSAGNDVKGLLVECGIWFVPVPIQFAAGLCLRTYAPYSSPL